MVLAPGARRGEVPIGIHTTHGQHNAPTPRSKRQVLSERVGGHSHLCDEVLSERHPPPRDDSAHVLVPLGCLGRVLHPLDEGEHVVVQVHHGVRSVDSLPGIVTSSVVRTCVTSSYNGNHTSS